MIYRKQLVLTLAAAVSFLVPVSAVVAQSNTAPTAQAQNKKMKTVKFTLQNTTSSPVMLKSGDEQMTLAAGQSRAVKAQAGTRIVTTAPSAAGDTGTVIAEVSDGMDGSTVNVR